MFLFLSVAVSFSPFDGCPRRAGTIVLICTFSHTSAPIRLAVTAEEVRRVRRRRRPLVAHPVHGDLGLPVVVRRAAELPHRVRSPRVRVVVRGRHRVVLAERHGDDGVAVEDVAAERDRARREAAVLRPRAELAVAVGAPHEEAARLRQRREVQRARRNARDVLARRECHDGGRHLVHRARVGAELAVLVGAPRVDAAHVGERHDVVVARRDDGDALRERDLVDAARVVVAELAVARVADGPHLARVAEEDGEAGAVGEAEDVALHALHEVARAVHPGARVAEGAEGVAAALLRGEHGAVERLVGEHLHVRVLLAELGGAVHGRLPAEAARLAADGDATLLAVPEEAGAEARVEGAAAQRVLHLKAQALRAGVDVVGHVGAGDAERQVEPADAAGTHGEDAARRLVEREHRRVDRDVHVGGRRVVVDRADRDVERQRGRHGKVQVQLLRRLVRRHVELRRDVDDAALDDAELRRLDRVVTRRVHARDAHREGDGALLVRRRVGVEARRRLPRREVQGVGAARVGVLGDEDDGAHGGRGREDDLRLGRRVARDGEEVGQRADEEGGRRRGDRAAHLGPGEDVAELLVVHVRAAARELQLEVLLRRANIARLKRRGHRELRRRHARGQRHRRRVEREARRGVERHGERRAHRRRQREVQRDRLLVVVQERDRVDADGQRPV
mmetsp:Transcript_15789/g.48966  ORF Transcript_15789/g.48966 Transcript_15789/m.48966 type:complete len:679 (-) Transcript_15789:1691-3727(-)